ncbi:hypothetical protein BASA81_009163 [Batrachochytrium salamandrivorans]|nr:hypothetical protein BASA81_009163 [Batrachochytrium salamandrivorans]
MSSQDKVSDSTTHTTDNDPRNSRQSEQSFKSYKYLYSEHQMSILSPSQHSSVHIDSDGWKYRQSGLSSPLHQNASRPEMAVINGSQNNKVYSLPALNAPKCGRLNVAQPYQSRYSSTLANQLHQTDSPYSDDSYDVMGSAGFDPSSSIRLAQLEYSLAPLHKAPSKLSKIIKYPQLINPALRHVQQQHQQGITINSSHPVIDSANSDDTELGTAPSKPSNLHFQKTGQYLGAIESPKDSVDASIPSMPLPSDNVSNSTLNTPLQWPATAIKRHTKSLKMSPTGIFSAKQRVPYDVLANARYVMDEEFQTMRYTAATCDPDHFIARGYDTRASRFGRAIEIFIVVTMYNEGEGAFLRTMFALLKNIRYLCAKTRYGWSTESWKKVVICIVADGRAKVHPVVLNVLEALGVYQEGLAQASVNGEETRAHIYEYTTQLAIDEKLNMWTSKEGIPPMQIIFCLKEKVSKKMNSHRWFFRAFCPLLNPRVCMLVDVGTKPEEKSIYRLWKAFYRNSQIAGACGEIRVDMGEGFLYIKNLLNPLVASQNFEYKISNLLDKSLESVFGYVSVLPDAFSAYRYEALEDASLGVGPLSRYFESEMSKGVCHDRSIINANPYLGGDRILCFELIAKYKSRWTLHYVSNAYADTNVPDTISEFLLQRRRWLGESLFAGFYTMTNMGRIWLTSHSILRKITFTFQFVYNVMTQIFSWFLLGNFTILFYYLINELSLTISSPSTNLRGVIIKTVPAVIDVIKYAYPAVLVCLVIISFGSRPRVYQIFYTTLMFVFGIIGIGMMGILAHRIYLLTKQQFAATSPDTEFRNLFANLTRMAGYETNDSAQLLMNSILIQTNRVYQEHLQANIASNRTDLMFFGMVFGSTLGGFILSGMLHMDVAHLITCFVQYLMLQPSYINILTVYAFANLRGATWETKGDTQAVKLPSINTKRQSDGTAVAEITVTLDRRDISEHYKQALHCMTASAVSTDVTKYEMETEARQEDKYKGFRTALVLSYIASNAVLFAVAANIGINLYILVLIGVVSFLNGTKMVGVVLFVGLRLFTKIFSRLGIWGRWHRGSQVSTSFAYETWKARPAKKNMLCDNGEVDLSRHSLDHSETTLGSPILYN